MNITMSKLDDTEEIGRGRGGGQGVAGGGVCGGAD